MTTIQNPRVNKNVKRLAAFGAVAVAASVGTLLAVRANAAGIPMSQMTYTGYLETPEGTPVTKKVNLGVAIWSDAKAGTKVCETLAPDVAPVSGRFQITLKDECTTAVKNSANLWLELSVDGAALGRTPVGTVPYAIEAGHATLADSASKADKASAAADGLATQLTGLDGRIASATAPKLSGYLADALTISDSKTWAFAGLPATKASPGRYWVFNNFTAIASDLGCTLAAASCAHWGTAHFQSCARVGGKIQLPSGYVVSDLEHVDKMATVLSTTGFFDFAAATDGVEFGLCALRHDAKTNTYDPAVPHLNVNVMYQPK